MQINKGFKIQTLQFENVSFYVTLSHEDLGLVEPRSAKEARDTYAELSLQAEALCAIELVKLGRLQPKQLNEVLRPWLPASAASTTTGQGSPSEPSP